MLKWDYTLYLVTDRSYIGDRNLEDCVEEAILGGATMVQLREKTASSLDFYHLAVKIKGVTRKYQVPLMINDRLDIALAIDADGLHLGQDDLPIEIARRYFGREKVIGISVSTVEEALLAEKSGADYLGAGAVFPTGTKTDAKLVSLPELSLIKKAVKIPVVAIGGINETNACDVFHTGIDGLSVVSAILARKDPRKASAEIKARITG
ncbi:thiamine-phosphate diphosphorylase [Syntrophobotulus glycolicus DSM 8271]|uniref:Thiamine-phosphate synthase n=1 Tax=Syntrophobotulus glycolicus (strain DSM 8271 / FlGlyR) TaxID=645991 RepID=F0SUV9_SYNGF|nr:thiamine phosphate synthase [Syntrophobotulus glycolicus]ADY56675.1 thiamine-phosphate diphosphorylase [Syntrophobotulus glycolicus DSM 8271]